MNMRDLYEEEQVVELPSEFITEVPTTEDTEVEAESREITSLTICHHEIVNVPPKELTKPPITFTICHYEGVDIPSSQLKQERIKADSDLPDPIADDVDMERYMLAPLAVAGVGWVLWSLAKWALLGSPWK